MTDLNHMTDIADVSGATIDEIAANIAEAMLPLDDAAVEEQMLRVIAARTALVLDSPFYGTLALRLKMVANHLASTFRTDGTSIEFNPRFCSTLSKEEVLGVIAHEVLHNVAGHSWRRGNRDPRMWNVAADYAINGILITAGFVLPNGALLPTDLAAKLNALADSPGGATVVTENGGTLMGLSAEQLYSILEEYAEIDKGGGGCGPGNPEAEADDDQPQPGEGDGADDDQSQPGDGDEAGDDQSQPGEGDGGRGNPEGGSSDGSETGSGKIKIPEQTFGEVVDPKPDAGQSVDEKKAEVETEWRVASHQATQQEKLCGTGISDELRELVEDSSKARQDWRALLRRWMTDRATERLSYARPNRRYSGGDIIMPSLVSEGMGSLVLGVDTSGSISREEIEMFVAELRLLIEEVKPTRTHVIYCHTRVWQHDTFESGEEVVVPDHIQTGGTMFTPVFDVVEREGIDPAGLIYFTDLCCRDYPGTEPDFPVMWAATDTRWDSTPWGQIVDISEVCDG